MTCPECYSEHFRITPLLNPRDCLENHQQYICGTCGRCICIQADEKCGLRRWNFPFKTAEIARLYLRTADVTAETNCGIYEIISISGRKSYKIFPQQSDFERYLNKHNKLTIQMMPVYQADHFEEFALAEIRHLTAEEITVYFQERE
ncbi:hypothetical protein [Candidatus Enterococcus ferrettii]|uniref:Uncharacterized protein n=1 Tax=Candidatus Enterococcus ferrettii TaxID=2815324 RepID=A0ABV0ELU5_9ENTE|nr:hypothetical protein [Enterococcus sp. 665A]MBO1342938.1 hypothetical protein [Enterococcus sp. 665A]